MLSAAKLSSLLSALYDAAADQNLWSAFLQQLAAESHSDAADLVMHEVQRELHSVSMSWGMDPQGIALYNQHYYQLDPWAAIGCLKPPNWIGTSEELTDPAVMASGEFYNDFLRPKLDLLHAMFSVVEKDSGKIASLGVFRAPDRAAFDDDSLQLMRLLLPHLKNAFRIHTELCRLKEVNASVHAALDMVSTPLVLLDSYGRVAVRNRAAAKLLCSKDGLVLTHTGLRAERPSESARLERLISDAVATSRCKGCHPAGAQLVSRNSGPPLCVVISPVRNVAMEGLPAICAVAIINDPSQRNRPAGELLGLLFGLTPAESRVALLLADGRSAREIASMLCVTKNTLKSHLASIYSKTSTSGQSQLVKLLTQLAALSPDKAAETRA